MLYPFKKGFNVLSMALLLILLVMPLQVQAEGTTTPIVENVEIDNRIIVPRYNSNEAAATVEFQLNRPAEVQLVAVQQYYSEVYHGPKQILQSGVHELQWHGMMNNGAPLRINEGQYVFVRATELVNGKPEPSTRRDFMLSVTIDNGEYQIPDWRMEELIEEVELDQLEIFVSQTEANTEIKGAVTLSEDAKVDISIVNKVGVNVKFLQSKEERPGVHTFTWNGTDFDGTDFHTGDLVPSNTNVNNGTYYLRIDVTEHRGTKGTKTVQELPILVKGGTEFPLPENPQMVRVIVPTTHLGGYMAKEGENIPMKWGYPTRDGVILRGIMVDFGGSNIFEETVDKGTSLRILREEEEGEWYRVLAPSGKQLYIRAKDLSFKPITSPIITHTVAAGDTLWNIGQRYGVTVDVIVIINQLDPKNILK
ncbi:MAG: LysM peptidoglycan-binding domain-containing protein [Clostridiaceae bacterium]|nr:LysM peptidoglycan-binding domain-containing protein [Clostridiaceae bacterium]